MKPDKLNKQYFETKKTFQNKKVKKLVLEEEFII